MNKRKIQWISDRAFQADLEYLEKRWQKAVVGTMEWPIIDCGKGEPLVFAPVLEQFEFTYIKQIQALQQHRRVLLYKQRPTRTRRIGLQERAEELRQFLDNLEIKTPDLIGVGSGAMILLTFALRYPQRCRSLTVIAQGAESHLSPYPINWLLQEFYHRLPLEYVWPAALIRQQIVQATCYCTRDNPTLSALPRYLIEQQIHKIYQLPFVYKCSVLPLIQHFDIRKQVKALTMPVLLINRADDMLAPEHKTRWLAEQLPQCAGYHIVAGREHFFTYSQAEIVTPLIDAFLTMRDRTSVPLKRSF